ncbi:MAG: hypothetical protein KFF73_16185 [Cyclobacteriaceae bacterium]|nr:hypothetical protein [Cyclobacteriaceae bacterium]
MSGSQFIRVPCLKTLMQENKASPITARGVIPLEPSAGVTYKYPIEKEYSPLV